MTFEPRLAEQLQSLIDAVTIHSPTSFSFADLPPTHIPEAASPVATRSELIRRLADTLYWNGYTRHWTGSARPSQAVEFSTDLKFVQGLADANDTQAGWDPDWEVYRLGLDGEVQVRKGDQHRSPVPGEFATDTGPGIRPQVGHLVSVRILAGSTQVQPGFYFCFSETIPDQFDEYSTIRFYFNISASGAPLLISALTKRLNRFQVPFRLKCPSNPDLFDRLDSGVLYVPTRYHQITMRLISEQHSALAGELSDETPLFCKRLRPGLALAEEPEPRMSFGLHRCRILAEVLTTGDSAGALDRLSERLLSAGIDVARPWLNPGSADVYELPTPVSIAL